MPMRFHRLDLVLAASFSSQKKKEDQTEIDTLQGPCEIRPFPKSLGHPKGAASTIFRLGPYRPGLAGRRYSI